jgi:hypothetical protein
LKFRRHLKLRVLLVGLLLIAPVSLTACGENASGPASNERDVSSTSYGSAWPLTVDSGTLRCEGAGAVTFTSEDGTTYWVNGAAGGQADERGWSNIRSIWADDPSLEGLKISIGPLIDDGLELCGY